MSYLRPLLSRCPCGQHITHSIQSISTRSLWSSQSLIALMLWIETTGFSRRCYRFLLLSAKGRSLQRAAIEYDLATQITDLLVLPESEDLVVRFGGEGEQR